MSSDISLFLIMFFRDKSDFRLFSIRLYASVHQQKNHASATVNKRKNLNAFSSHFELPKIDVMYCNKPELLYVEPATEDCLQNYDKFYMF